MLNVSSKMPCMIKPAKYGNNMCAMCLKNRFV